MAVPLIYYSNLFAQGVLSGTNIDEAFPVRRVADDNITLPYPIVSGTVSGLLSGQVQVTAASGVTRDYFILVRGESLSGHEFTVFSDDIGGGSFATHGTQAASGDAPFVLELTGTATARRVWGVIVSGTVSGLPTPRVFEMMLPKRLVFPRRPQIGVSRSVIHQKQRLEIPGGAPFVVRLGEDFQQDVYTMIAEETLVASGLRAFVRENDGGQPVWHVNDKAESYWGETPDAEFRFDDQAGVEFFNLTVREIPAE